MDLLLIGLYDHMYAVQVTISYKEAMRFLMSKPMIILHHVFVPLVGFPLLMHYRGGSGDCLLGTRLDDDGGDNEGSRGGEDVVAHFQDNFICGDGYCDDKDLPLWQLVKHSIFINPRKFPALFCSRAELFHSPLSVEIVFAK